MNECESWNEMNNQQQNNNQLTEVNIAVNIIAVELIWNRSS